MKPYYQAHGVTLFHGDAREVLPPLALRGHVVVTDPVWPDAPAGMFAVENPAALFAEVARAWGEPRRAVVVLGCASDPRFLQGVPPSLPFVRVVHLRYSWPSYKGTVLNGGDVAYVYGDHRASPGFRVLPGEYTSPGCQGPDQFAARRSGHPCPRDESATRWLVATFTQPGDVVVDPFTGSGTTLLAATAAGRAAVGVELEERYCEIAARRLEVHARAPRLLDVAVTPKQADMWRVKPAGRRRRSEGA